MILSRVKDRFRFCDMVVGCKSGLEVTLSMIGLPGSSIGFCGSLSDSAGAGVVGGSAFIF